MKQAAHTENRDKLLNMIAGGAGYTKNFVEIVRYITPDGKPNGEGYREHHFNRHYQTGKPYEYICESGSKELLSLLWDYREEETGIESPLSILDLGTTEIGAPPSPSGIRWYYKGAEGQAH